MTNPPRDRDAELNEELAAHLRMAAQDRMARGESRDAAEAAARRELGNLTHIKEVTREVTGRLWIERLVQDVRYGLRALRRTPAFTVVAVLTLTLAIGANSAVFTVVNSVLLRPLPFRDADRLYLASHLPTDLPFEMPPGLADRAWLAYRERVRSFERVSAYGRMQMTLSGAGDAVRFNGARVDASFLPVLGVAPGLGRGFSRDEETPGRDRVVMLSDRAWRERFSADRAVLDRLVTLEGVPYRVVGVMPPGFNFPAASEIWTPLAITLDRGNSFLLTVLGRLRDGATPEQARAELASIMASMPKDPRDDGRVSQAKMLPLKDVITGKVATSLFLFAGAVAFVLLIAGANLANLLLIRAATRRREMAVRVALGASRLRLARQLLTETALVGLAGGLAGVLVAQLGVRLLLAIAPRNRIPRLDEVDVDGRVLIVTIAVAVITSIVFGVIPALQSTRHQPGEALAHSARVVGGGQRRLRGLLASAEVALALILLTGAGLMIKSFVNLRRADKGYDGARVMTMHVELPRARYGDATRLRAFHGDVLARLAAIPGVRRVSGVSFTPMGGVSVMGDFTIDGGKRFPPGYNVDKALVAPGYFGTMGVPILQGREFTPADDGRAPKTVIVSEAVARRVWPNEDPIGRRISMADKPKPEDWLTVIGVANDVAQDAMSKHSTVYLPYLQSDGTWMLGAMTFVVRADPGARVGAAMRDALHTVDAAVPAGQLRTMDDAVLEVVAEPLFQTRLLVVFSLIAILLAAIGTYGVLAYDVAERTREIALRMALGATARDVMRMVMRRTGVLAVSGAVVGLAGSLAITSVLTKSLFEVKPSDPSTLAVVFAAIVLVALVAGYVPARRATRVDVLTALPQE
jgi:putative ABC transport system permease protein